MRLTCSLLHTPGTDTMEFLCFTPEKNAIVTVFTVRLHFTVKNSTRLLALML